MECKKKIIDVKNKSKSPSGNGTVALDESEKKNVIKFMFFIIVPHSFQQTMT